MKLLTAIASLTLSLVPLSANALPVSNLAFSQGSTCGTSNSDTHWTSVKASANQRLAIGIVDMPMDSYEIKITNNTSGKTYRVEGEFTTDGTFISETFTLRNNGSYTIKMYYTELGYDENGKGFPTQEVNLPLTVCIK